MVTILLVYILCYAGQGRISATLGLSLPSTAHANDNIGGHTDASKGVSTRMRTRLKRIFSPTCLDGPATFLIYFFHMFWSSQPQRSTWLWIALKLSLNSVRHLLFGFLSCTISVYFQHVSTGCCKKSFTTLKTCVNLFRGHVQCFELS
jgi:hypothetical protein